MLLMVPCAGVIWKGDKLINGVPETLDMLRSMGKKLVFVTNNSTKSRKQYGKKFESLGLDVTEEEIFASSFAAAAYLKSINFPSDKKVQTFLSLDTLYEQLNFSVPS
jgi:phosphoglycolate phosphatase